MATGQYHVHKTVHIGIVTGLGIVDRTRHGAQCGLVGDVSDLGAGVLAGLNVANITFDEFESSEGTRLNAILDCLQVFAGSGGEIVETADDLP